MNQPQYLFGAPYTLPPLVKAGEFNHLLLKCAEVNGVSDLIFSTDEPLWVRHNGYLRRVTSDYFDTSGLAQIISEIKSASVASSIQSGKPYSWIHRTRVGDSRQKARFRFSGSSINTRQGDGGFRIVVRPVPELPPDFAELDLPEALKLALKHRSGVVLFSGPTGSGKTTALFSVLLDRLLYGPGENIATLEEPIEFDLKNLPIDLDEVRTGHIGQAEYGANFASFPIAMRGLLRDNPDVILVGEMRDLDTIRLALEASLTGHAVYSTVHVNRVSAALSRVILTFPANEQSNMATSLISSLQVLVCQRLLPKIGGGRIAIIEYALFDDSDRLQMKEAFTRGGINEVETLLHRKVMSGERAQSFLESARERFKANLIDEHQLNETIVDCG